METWSGKRLTRRSRLKLRRNNVGYASRAPGCHGLTKGTRQGRILQFLEQDAVNQFKLEELPKEFNLADKRAQFASKYIEGRK